MQQSNGRIAWAWIWVVVWVAVIMGFASEGFSAGSTSHYLTPFLRWLDPDMPWQTIREIHFAVRKCAHVTEYAVLALLAFRAFHLTLALPPAHLALLSLAVVVGVAGLDELRQSVLPTRTGSAADVALDLGGGALGVGVLILVHRWLGVRRPLAGSGA